MTKRILVADDEKSVRQLLDLVLRGQGYEVTLAQDGDQLVRAAQEQVPDLVLVDLMMPGLDGYEAIRQLRNDTRTAHIPMLILTARSTPNDVVVGFESGADDYITKPFNIPELLARIKGHLRRASQRSVRNPLTDLPGNVLITEEVKYRIRRGDPFAFLYFDLDNFKAFNDTYGPARGDRVIRLVAEVLIEASQSHGHPSDFIGHIGGDDFAVLTIPDVVDALCRTVIATFDERVRQLYDPEDLKRGYLQGVDRQGFARRFPIITISIGGVTTEQRRFHDYDEVSRVAADMKQYAKQQAGSTYAIDVRDPRAAAISGDRRGKQLPTVMLISPDAELQMLLRGALDVAGYRVLEAPGVPEAHGLLAHEFQPTLIAADAQIGALLWEFADHLQVVSPEVPLLVLSARGDDEARALSHGARAFLLHPFQVQQFIAAVERLVQKDDAPA